MNKLISCLIITSFLISGCKSLKNPTSQKVPKEIQQVISKVQNNNFDFETLKAKGKIEINIPDLNQTATLYLRVKKDSIIWGSVTYLMGYEVVRFFIDKENITILYKYNRTYSVYPISYIEKLYPLPEIDYTYLEKLILGKSVYDLSKGFEIAEKDDQIILSKTKNNIDKKVMIDPSKATLAGYNLYMEEKKQRAVLNYSEEICSDSICIPKNVEIKVYLPEINSLILNYSSIDFNKPISINTSIPNGYTKVD